MKSKTLTSAVRALSVVALLSSCMAMAQQHTGKTCKPRFTTNAALTTLLFSELKLPPVTTLYERNVRDTTGDDPKGCCCIGAGGTPECESGVTEKLCKNNAESAHLDWKWKEGECSK